ncbi:MAG TPA: amino acid adenylation domain-containing protein, partial [Thermoanaerobaculia bacterium]
RLCLHRRFEAQVDRAPEAVAVSADGEPLTYRDLDAWANRIARHLQASGVRPGDRVALRLERSAGMVAALLGVLKAGAAYVPIDPAYPEERIAFTLEDSGAALLLAAADLAAAGSCGARRLEVPVAPDLPAYVIYTSGSTGRPKGVVVTHANAARLFTATDPWLNFGSEDVWTLFHSYAFDFSVWEIWGALLYGGRLVVVPYWVSRSPEAFHALLREERVTVLNQTPSAFRQLIWAAEGRPADLALRYVIFGGEALEPASLAPWVARYGDQKPRLINMYGITETTVHVTYRPLGTADLAGGSRIGQPIPDLAVHLLDAGLQPVPVGVPGEIHVGGAGLAQGYLHRPDLTAARFVPDPFAGRPGARLYRSGDLARRLAGGDLEYLGRADQQVKIRGFRIELGEIEAALTEQPGVREAVVLARSDRSGGSDRSLVAYLVGEELDAAALRAALGRRLPDYMVPTAFVFLAALPLTGHGKVDRRALPAPDAATPAAATGPPPRDLLERFLAGQFHDVLALPAARELGVGESFFDLGGTSITTAIFTHRLQEALGETVHVVAIFDHPTVASLADYVRESHPAAARRLLEGGEAAGPAAERGILAPIQTGSPDRRPLFCVHSVGGEVVAYRDLARLLGPEQPVWGLQSPDPPLEDVEEMARHYIAAMRPVQPRGPYRIAGWSMGGV